MNILFVSPHFPPNYTNFCVALRRAGANVLGIADTPHDSLRYELRTALTEYFRVDEMSYDELLRGVAFLTYPARQNRPPRIAQRALVGDRCTPAHRLQHPRHQSR